MTAGTRATDRLDYAAIVAELAARAVVVVDVRADPDGPEKTARRLAHAVGVAWEVYGGPGAVAVFPAWSSAEARVVARTLGVSESGA